MLSRVVKGYQKINKAYFASKKKATKEVEQKVESKVELKKEAPKEVYNPQPVGQNTVYQNPTEARLNLNTNQLYMEYKSYRHDISHCNHDHPDYIHAERDDEKQNTPIEQYNEVIRQLKNDINLHRQVQEALEKMDRPYKSGLPGVHRNITGGVRDYFPAQNLGFQVQTEDADNVFYEKSFKNENAWLDQSVYYPKYAPMTHYDVEWQKELDERPVNDHFHADKGSKYDVDVPYEERYPYLADRLGHPEILGTPFERLMRLESEIYHPNYLDQPFVQIPGAEPHNSLNFEEGEVIYENNRITEWSKFYTLTGVGIYGFLGMFVPFSLIVKTHLPLLGAYDNLFLPYYNHSYFFFDNNALHIPTIAGVASYVAYYALASGHRYMKDYVVKMQYSKDKELLFVTRVTPFGSTEEEVFEVAHLESLPPSVKAGVAHLSSQDEDGLWDITCMNTQQNLVVYNEDKYWNPELKKEFFNKVTGMWANNVEGNRYQKVFEKSLTTTSSQ